MSKISDLKFQYLHRKLAASGDNPTQYAASAGTKRTAVSAALTEANDYWNGAIVRWDDGPNAGLYSRVVDFDAASDTVTLANDLPSAVANGHHFTLFHCGKHISGQRIPGMVAAAPVNITGFSIVYAAMINGAGTGQLTYVYDGGDHPTLAWTPPGESIGATVIIGGTAEGDLVTLYGGGSSETQRSKYLVLQRTASVLPVTDQVDDVGLQYPTGTFLGVFTGLETEAGTTTYRPIGIHNAGEGVLGAVAAYCPSPWPTAASTTIAAGGSIGTGADVLDATSLANWGTSGWVYNATKDDVRYFFERSGNTCRVLNPAGGMRGFNAVAWEEGDAIEPFPWMDIGLDAPGAAEVFEDPDGQNAAPAGVAFSCPRTAETGLAIGDIAADGVYCIWERFFIPAGFRPVEAQLATLQIYAEVLE
jgi:hypothetical protein